MEPPLVVLASIAEPRLDAGHTGTAGQTPRWSVMAILANILIG